MPESPPKRFTCLAFLQFRAFFGPKGKKFNISAVGSKKMLPTAEKLNFFALVRKMCSKLRKC